MIPVTIKIPTHLIPLIVEGRSVVYSDFYDFETYKSIQTIATLNSIDLKYSSFLNSLNANFKRVETINEAGELSIRGDVVVVWLYGYNNPLRLEFFGEDCEQIYEVDSITLTPIRKLDRIVLLPPNLYHLENHIQILDQNTALNTILFTQRILEHTELPECFINSDFTIPSLYFGKLDIFKQEVENLKAQGYSVYILSNPQNLAESFHSDIKKLDFSLSITNNKIEIKKDNTLNFQLPAGFISKDHKIAVFTDRELFSSISVVNKSFGKVSNVNVNRLLSQFEGSIEINNFVVHEMYGIAKYKGLKQEMANGVKQDYLLLEYAGGDELYVPLFQIDKITKYIGPESAEPELTKLGSIKWANAKRKVKTATKILAKELLEHFAKRELSHAKKISDSKKSKYSDFVSKFKYTETTDQARAISEVLFDLEQEIPMNRLIIGDVGFGKTEVILRAVFKTVENGGQVALLAPTTVLVAQHYKVFCERFKDFGVSIDFVSRFKKSFKNKEAIEKLKSGDTDIIIGTHRLLSNDINFKNLQLLVVDEEQKFGVKQKEKIKKLNYGVHLLMVSATPIPRTLSMALSTIQDISVITTPPKGRQGIYTEILKDDWGKAIEAIQKEITRGGQVYFVHNTVYDIHNIKQKLMLLSPNIRIAVAHGQMDPLELDKIMYDFYNKKYDLLLCTTIIENGLDLENVNTIIINNAHRLGLAQLYQLRGRVGRSTQKAYCYLLYTGKRQLDEDQTHQFASIDDEVNYNLAKKKEPPKKYLERLQSLVENQDLGAGYRIASRDLEIRGAGNILGDKQHGHIMSIGYTLYIQLLAQEVERLKSLGINSK